MAAGRRLLSGEIWRTQVGPDVHSKTRWRIYGNTGDSLKAVEKTVSMTAKERHHRAFLSVQQTQVTLRDLYMSVDGERWALVAQIMTWSGQNSLDTKLT